MTKVGDSLNNRSELIVHFPEKIKLRSIKEYYSILLTPSAEVQTLCQNLREQFITEVSPLKGTHKKPHVTICSFEAEREVGLSFLKGFLAYAAEYLPCEAKIADFVFFEKQGILGLRVNSVLMNGINDQLKSLKSEHGIKQLRLWGTPHITLGNDIKKKKYPAVHNFMKRHQLNATWEVTQIKSLRNTGSKWENVQFPR